MKTRSVKTPLLAALAAAALVVPAAANADTVTQLIHFDDANNGWKWYSDKDLNFLFDPTNLQSSTLCADSTNGGNGSCVIEGNQGVLPLMTRPTNGPQSQGSASKDPVVSGLEKFTLDSFYFLLTGNGEGAANAITATGSNGKTFTFQLGGTYSGPLSPLPSTAPAVTFYEGLNAGGPAGALVKQTGYIVSFGDLFQDVTSIQFSAPTTAQVRLDCVVATFDGTTTEPASGFTNGCGVQTSSSSSNGGPPSAGQAPEPGSSGLAVLALGMVGAGLWSRNRRAKRA